MWEELGIPINVRIWLRKMRLFWRGKFALKWFAIWTVALVVYLVVGLRPAEAKNYEIVGQLEIPEIGLSSEVAEVRIENGRLETPEALVGSFKRDAGKTLLFGHSTGVFRDLDEVKVGERIWYGGEGYSVSEKRVMAKEKIDMGEILEGRDEEGLVLMTCAGTVFLNGDASERLVVMANRE